MDAALGRVAVRALVAILVVGASSGGAAATAHAQGLDPRNDPARYCDANPMPGSLGAVSDAEHSVKLGDPPLRPGMRRRRVTVGGVSTVVTEAGRPGDDEAVVFAHGSPNHGREWDRLLSAAGRHGRAIAFDFPGFGNADDRLGGDYTIAGAARFYGRLMKKLGVRRVHLVMHDLGGMWSLESSIRNPASLKSVVVIDSGVLIDYIGHPLAAAYVTPVVGEATMAATTRPSFTASIQGQNPKPLPASFVDRMYDFMDRRTRCAILPYYRDIKDPDAVGRRQAAVLRKRRRPALVVWGEQDPYIPSYVAYKQRQAFPGARVEIIPNAGHWPFIDYPGRVERLVVPFLRRALRGESSGSPPDRGDGSTAGQGCAGRPATLSGTAGDDELRGTSGPDVIVAGSGRDRVRAGGGADLVCAGSGADRVDGGEGDDRLDGGSADDTLSGASGADELLGASGRDRCVGGDGADRSDGCEG